MSKQTLRLLAKDYAKGVIDKEKYRKSRSDLIKAIIAGEIAVAPIDYLPPISPAEEELSDTIQRERTEIKVEEPLATSKKNNPAPVKQTNTPREEKKLPWMFISISIVIVLSLIMVVILFYPAPPTATTETIVETKSTSSTVDNESSKAAEDLIADFLMQKNWSEESLDGFTTAWYSLTQEERDAASQTKRMQRMRASIYKQFLEEKALASIDSDKAIMKQQKLIEFANAIGIDDPRLILD